jgi:hypothetical protein
VTITEPRFRSRSQSYFTTKSQSVCLGIEHPSGTYDQILLAVGMLLSEICGLVSVGRPLWREDGSAICSVITRWSESLRIRNLTLLSHLRLPQPGGTSCLIIRVRVTFRLTVCLDVGPTWWTFNQILLPFQVFGSEICCLVSVGRPLWREVGSVIRLSQDSNFPLFTSNIYVTCVLQFSNLYTINTKFQSVPSEYSRLCSTSYY